MTLSQHDKYRLGMLVVALGLSIAGSWLAARKLEGGRHDALILSICLCLAAPLGCIAAVFFPASLLITFVAGIIASSLQLYVNYWQISGVLLSLLCLPLTLTLDSLVARVYRCIPSIMVVAGVIVTLTGEFDDYNSGSCMYAVGVAIASVAVLFTSNHFFSLITLFAAVVSFSNVLSFAVFVLLERASFDPDHFPHYTTGVVITCMGLFGIIYLLFSSMIATQQRATVHLRLRAGGIFITFAASLAIIFFLAGVEWTRIVLTEDLAILYIYYKGSFICDLCLAALIPVFFFISVVWPSLLLPARASALALIVTSEASIVDMMYQIIISEHPLNSPASTSFNIVVGQMLLTLLALLLTIFPLYGFRIPSLTAKNILTLFFVIGVCATAVCGLLSGMNWNVPCGMILEIHLVCCFLLIGCVGINSLFLKHISVFALTTLTFFSLSTFISVFYRWHPGSDPDLFYLWMWGSSCFLFCGALSLLIEPPQETQDAMYNPIA